MQNSSFITFTYSSHSSSSFSDISYIDDKKDTRHGIYYPAAMSGSHNLCAVFAHIAQLLHHTI